MTDNERKEVNELAKAICPSLDKACATCMESAEKTIKLGYTKRPQDNNPEEGETKNDIAWQQGYAAGKKANNALVPLDCSEEGSLSYFLDELNISVMDRTKIFIK